MLDIPTDLATTKLLVLAWTDHFFGTDYLEHQRIDNPNGPDIELAFTTDRDRLDEADAVWFHGPSLSDLPPRKRQTWILMSMESEENYGALRNPLVTARFDVLMTYRLDSDVPCIYPNWRHYGTFLDPPPARSGPSPGALAAYIASNPVARRDAYVSDLMQYLSIDSLGSCLKNANADGLVSGAWTDGAWGGLLSVLPDYKFYLAFENSVTTDYVTERVFHALVCGVVPVYLGAPNVRDFMPDDDAIIDASDFSSPRELADYLRHLDADDEAYAKHLRWKTNGYSDRFKALVEFGSVDPHHRMAVKLAHGCDRSCRCGGRRREPGALA
jgi:hypothetical protein